MCDLHNKKIISRWFPYVTNITEISVLNIGFSKLSDIAATLILPAAKKPCWLIYHRMDTSFQAI